MSKTDEIVALIQAKGYGLYSGVNHAGGVSTGSGEYRKGRRYVRLVTCGTDTSSHRFVSLTVAPALSGIDARTYRTVAGALTALEALR